MIPNIRMPARALPSMALLIFLPYRRLLAKIWFFGMKGCGMPP